MKLNGGGANHASFTYYLWLLPFLPKSNFSNWQRLRTAEPVVFPICPSAEALGTSAPV